MQSRTASILAGTVAAIVTSLVLSPLTERRADAAYVPVPSGAILHFSASACPTGWTEFTAARGAYIVGLPSGGTLATMVGTALTNLENRAAGIHTHTATSSTPTGSSSTPTGTSSAVQLSSDYPVFLNTPLTTGAVNNNAATGATTTHVTTSVTPTITVSTPTITVGTPVITVANSTGVAGTNAPYVQLLTCKKN